LTDDGQPKPGARATRSHRKKTSPLLFLIPVVLVAAAVGLFLLLRDGGVDIPIIGGDNHDDTVPAFSFKVTKTKAVATSEDADLEALNAQAADIAAGITPMLDDLYTAAFLDPSNWRENDYEEVWEHFSDGARPSAEAAVETLTLGATAGDVYETVDPTKGRLQYEVLFDPDGSPDSVVVLVSFDALGERQDGTYTAIVSRGQLFMNDLGGWTITAFDVEREDHEAEPPPPTPSGTAAPSS
jgi:hypothetical protein